MHRRPLVVCGWHSFQFPRFHFMLCTCFLAEIKKMSDSKLNCFPILEAGYADSLTVPKNNNCLNTQICPREDLECIQEATKWRTVLFIAAFIGWFWMLELNLTTYLKIIGENSDNIAQQYVTTRWQRIYFHLACCILKTGTLNTLGHILLLLYFLLHDLVDAQDDRREPGRGHIGTMVLSLKTDWGEPFTYRNALVKS